MSDEDLSSSKEVRSLWRWLSAGAFIPSLCCLPSVVMVAFGLSSIATADALSKTLYFGIARPILYIISLILLGFGLWRYFQSQGICDLDEVKRQRRRIVNTTMLALGIVIVTYAIFNYVVLEILGIALGLPWEEDAFWN